jgi:hypothetical protein
MAKPVTIVAAARITDAMAGVTARLSRHLRISIPNDAIDLLHLLFCKPESQQELLL